MCGMWVRNSLSLLLSLMPCTFRCMQHPFTMGFLQPQQNAPAPSVDWEAAAKHYSAVRTQAPSSQQQEHGQEPAEKRKRASKGYKAVLEEAAEEDNVTPPGMLARLCCGWTPLGINS